MTSFVHVDQPGANLGVSRAPAVIGAGRTSKQPAANAGLTLGLVIAAGAVFLAIANPLTTREIDGGWMVAWIAVCAILLAAIGLSAHKLTPFMKRLAERRAIARSDAQMYEFARYDPRLMQELQAALTRHQAEGESMARGAAKP
jgi:thiol:disulfide interchange protein